MKTVVIDITGQRFTNLVAIQRKGSDSRRRALWLCVCDCGNEKIIRADHLKRGEQKDCGCPPIQVKKRRILYKTKYARKLFIREYKSWTGMIQRCENSGSKSYKNYGGREIRVCKRWRESFDNFYDDMGPRPKGDYTLDRIDNNGNYEPDNCRWATRSEQVNNRRLNNTVLFNGKAISISQAAEILNVPRTNLYYHYTKIKKTCDSQIRLNTDSGKFESI